MGPDLRTAGKGSILHIQQGVMSPSGLLLASPIWAIQGSLAERAWCMVSWAVWLYMEWFQFADNKGRKWRKWEEQGDKEEMYMGKAICWLWFENVTALGSGISEAITWLEMADSKATACVCLTQLLDRLAPIYDRHRFGGNPWVMPVYMAQTWSYTLYLTFYRTAPFWPFSIWTFSETLPLDTYFRLKCMIQLATFLLYSNSLLCPLPTHPDPL